MKTTSKHYLSLIALLAMLLLSSSCKDDDKSSDSEEATETDAVSGLLEDEDINLVRIIAKWCDIDKSDIPENVATKQYEPQIGVVLDQSTPRVRYMQADDVAQADSLANSMFASLGFDTAKPDNFSFTGSSFGTVKYRHATEADGGNVVAYIDIDMPSIPSLGEIRFVKSLGENADDKPYYRLGDIVDYKGCRYVCVTKHKHGETSEWITFGGTHTTGKCGWGKTGTDIVYNDNMADGLTIGAYIGRILAKPDVCEKVYEKAGDKAMDVAPPAAIRERLMDELIWEEIDGFNINATGAVIDMFSTPDLNPGKYVIQHFVSDSVVNGNTVTYYITPFAHFLADKMRWKMGLSYHYWVPYVMFARLDNASYYDLGFDAFSEEVDAIKSQVSVSPSHFHYYILGLHFSLDDDGAHKYKPYTVAAYWQHKTLEAKDTDYEYDINFIFDFTATRPNPVQASAEENFWLNRCITSRDVTFNDKGVANKNFTEVYVARNNKED